MDINRSKALAAGAALVTAFILTILLASGSLKWAEAQSTSTIDQIAIDADIAGNAATSIGAIDFCASAHFRLPYDA